ncbi:MAG: SPFH domain-containing protein [Breznakia sp.]
MKEENIKINVSMEEKALHPKSGMGILVLLIVGVMGAIALCIVSALYVDWEPLMATGIMISIVLLIVFIVMLFGLKVVNPKEALVLTLFGKYYGTIRNDGFFYVNPFVLSFNPTSYSTIEAFTTEVSESSSKKGDGKYRSSSKKISTKIITSNGTQQKVNDVAGNPIIIGSVVIWKVSEPTKAVFNVENYYDYLSAQSDSIIRNTVRRYPYDNMGNDEEEMTLRGSSMEIAERMRLELQEKVAEGGIEILEVRITHLSYAEEIAGAMLRKQQASATIAAREKIVEGAVGMVRMALDRLEEDDIILLDDERKAAMVSNLLVVLCGDKDAQPIVNSGSIY